MSWNPPRQGVLFILTSWSGRWQPCEPVPPGQVAIPAAPQQAAEQPPAQASGDEHIILPDASRQRPGEGVAGQPSPPAEQPTYVEPEGDPTIQPGEEPADAGPRYIEEAGDAVEGDDSTGVWTRTGWS